MKCGYSEQDIALFVEGDLEQARLLQIEAHLPECAACRLLADELRESQSIFKALRQDTVSAAALGHVRNRVLAEVAGVSSTTPWGRRVERWLFLGARRGYALAGVGLAVLMVIGLWYSRTPEVLLPAPLPAAAVPKDEPQPQVKAIVAVEQLDQHPRRQKARPAVTAKRVAPGESPKQLVVKLLTDDPNIVIYWLVDQNGG